MESKTVIKGIKWAGIQFALDAIFRFSVRLILAKLLLPEQFGLVGMGMVFIAVAGAASELGMGAALIQKKNDEEVTQMYPTAFWTGIIWGVGLFLVMAGLVGPFAAFFYNEPQLVNLVAALSIGILLKPLSLIHTVILTRSMNFKKIAQIFNFGSLIAGMIAIFAAYFSFGVWSLVINNILATAIPIPLLFSTTKWKPIIKWNKYHFKKIFGFGAYSTGTSIFSMVTYNIDNLMIGKFLGAGPLGAYTLSFTLTEQLRQIISNVMNKVMYPVFGKYQDDKLKLKYIFLKIININAILIYPIMTFFLIFSEEIIVGFFGEKWREAIIPLKILAIAMMVHLLVNSFTSLIRGLGKPGLEMKIILGLTLFVLLPALSAGIYFFGLKGAAGAILLNKVALALAGIWVLNREIGLKAGKIFSAIRSAIIGISIASMVVGILAFSTGSINFLIHAFAFVFVYVFMIYFLEKQHLKEILKKVL